MAPRASVFTLFAVAGLIAAAAPGLGMAGAVDEYRIIAPDSTDFQSPADQPEVLKPQARGPNTSPSGVSLWQMTAKQIEGMPVVTGESRHIGSVGKIVRNRATGRIEAVLALGGVLGIGGSKAVVPVSELQLQRDKRIVFATERPKELARLYPYDSSRYEPVKGDQLLASMQGRPGGLSFSALDRDGNGFISRDEAKAAAGLLHYWGRVDADGDGRLDRAEFSAYEQPGAHSRTLGTSGRAPDRTGE